MSELAGEIQVEFFGVARLKSGTSIVRLDATDSMTLTDLWRRLVAQFPRLEEDGLASSTERLYRFNLDGERFVTDPLTPILSGQCVLILSADAGG